MCYSDMETNHSTDKSAQLTDKTVQQLTGKSAQQSTGASAQPLSGNSVQRRASLDIGTVTCRLLLADVSDMSFVELERRVAITNLGIGVDKTHMLQTPNCRICFSNQFVQNSRASRYSYNSCCYECCS